MRRFPWIGAILLIPAIGGLVLVGCNKDAASRSGGEKTTTDASKKDKKTPAVEIVTATKATVKGTVKLTGERPKVESIKEDKAFKEHIDRAFCAMGDVNRQTWMIDNAGMVENVVVWLASPVGKKFKITDELRAPFKKKIVEIDQPFCQYIPHVAAVYAEIQESRVLNSAKIPHNVRISGSPKNGRTDEQLSPSKMTPVRKYFAQERPLVIECGAHSWMNAKLWTFDHPYFAVTKKDGSFMIENVPVAEELSVFVWHEAKEKWEAQKAAFKEGENSMPLTISVK